MICFAIAMILINGKLLYFYQPANLNLPSNQQLMKIAVHAGEQQRENFLLKIPADVSVHWLEPGGRAPEADAYFDLMGEDDELFPFRDVKDRPVFVHAVITTSEAFPANTIRINNWPGFFTGSIREIYASREIWDKAETVLQTLSWSYKNAPDTPGMIAARIVSMIINEAYFALGEGVSSRQEIDTAMKLGTNYPYGPFEWSEIIGLQKIHRLLQQLSENDSRYAIAPKLIEESTASKRINE
jgi:3-hydroxybutyryl-CoA dehydrogenase